MSSELRWELVVDTSKSLSDATKHVFRKKFGDPVSVMRIDSDDLPYLEGVRDATTDGNVRLDVEMLISRAANGDCIEVWEKF